MTPETVWLCAGELRRDGDSDDAYEHFTRLHAAGALGPTEGDCAVAAVEEFIWYVLPRAADMAHGIISTALDDPGVPYQSSDPTLPVAVISYVVEDEGYGVADLFVGFHTVTPATELGTTYIQVELLRLIAERLHIPNDWERGYDRHLPHHLTGTYRTTMGV